MTRRRRPHSKQPGGASQSASSAVRTPAASRHSGPRVPWFRLAAALALTLVAYLPSLGNSFTNWDDNFYVTENSSLAHPSARALLTTPVGGNYHPLTMASLALNYRLSGLDPGSYHALNLALHLVATLLVFFLVWRLSNGRVWTSLATGLLFGIHPMHVESVAWIAERKDVLYACFYLAGLIAYLRHLDLGRSRWLAVAWVAFVLSVASKPAAVVFPVTLFLIDGFRGRRLSAAAVLEKLPFLGVSLAAGVLTLRAQSGAGAISSVWTPFQKLLFASDALVMYVAKLFVPVRLSAIYPYPSPATGPGPQYLVVFAIAMVLLVAAVLVARRHAVVRFGLAFFLVHVVLVLQFFTLGGAVLAERYTYLSYVGLLFALTWWLDTPGRRPFSARSVVAVIVMVQVPLFVVLTWQRCAVWRNSETLWNDTIAKYPGQIADAYINRGYYYYSEAKRYDAAIADFDQALALNSATERIWSNKGLALAALARYDSALVCFERAVALAPKSAEAVNNRGAAQLELNQFASAIADFSRALELNPGFRDAYRNRSVARRALGDHVGAIADARRVIELDPGNPDHYAQWATVEADPLAPYAAGAIAHMNADHADAMALYCRAFS